MKELMFSLVLLISCLAMVACGGGSGGVAGPDDIGGDCSCDEAVATEQGGSCKVDMSQLGAGHMKMPLIFSKGVKGCEAVAKRAGDGEAVGCMTDITLDSGSGEQMLMKFGEGYCVKGAIKATFSGADAEDSKVKPITDSMLELLNAGKTDKIVLCPRGSILMHIDNTQTIAGKVEGKDVGLKLNLLSKICVRRCESDTECRGDAGYSCSPVSPFHGKGGFEFYPSGVEGDVEIGDARLCINKKNMAELKSTKP